MENTTIMGTTMLTDTRVKREPRIEAPEMNSLRNHALAVFRQPPDRLNCAQTVVHAYQLASGKVSLPVSEMKPFGGGRAPGGLCGALHAACVLMPEKAELFKTRFAEHLGSALCQELRAAKRHPCESCVAQAAELLEAETGRQ